MNNRQQATDSGLLFYQPYPQRRKTETKPDTYSKDRMFVTSFAFCVITFEPIEVQTCSAPQNDRQNLGFVKDIKVVVEKMTRNRRKVIGKPGDSLLCRLHSIQVSSLVYSFLYVQQWYCCPSISLKHCFGLQQNIIIINIRSTPNDSNSSKDVNNNIRFQGFFLQIRSFKIRETI